MFGAGLIVFRETLEAALFVGIMAASTRGLVRRTPWLWLGVSLGMLGSVVMASGMQTLSSLAEGLGQDLATLALLGVALLTLAWHCIWVSPHAGHRVVDARHLAAAANAAGASALWTLAVAVALAVAREGAETVLFVSGLASADDGTGVSILLAVIAGLTAGAAVGWAIYFGLGRLRLQLLFAITHVLVLMLAGSIASQLARALDQADLLTRFSQPAWDLSSWLPNSSLAGALLHGLVATTPTPV